MKSTWTENKIDLKQLVNFFKKKKMDGHAQYFERQQEPYGAAKEGWIGESFVKKMLGHNQSWRSEEEVIQDEKLWRELRAAITTWMPVTYETIILTEK